MTKDGSETVYARGAADTAEALQDDRASGDDAEAAGNGCATAQRCAEALAAHAAMPWAPVLEIGCGAGLSGAALGAAGFECLDGFDISEGMRAKALATGLYRAVAALDLSEPLDAIDEATYQNAAAISVLNPDVMPPTVIDDILSKLPSGGCFVFSLNDRTGADGSFATRVFELCEYGVADLVHKDIGKCRPEHDLQSTVFVLKKR